MYEVIYTKIPTISQKYDFTTLEDIQFDSREMIDIFFRLLNEINLETLPNLRALQFLVDVDVDFLLNEINHISFPNLRILTLYLMIPADS
jgi:hypothetical protein